MTKLLSLCFIYIYLYNIYILYTQTYIYTYIRKTQMQILKIPKQVCILGRVVLCFKGLLPPPQWAPCGSANIIHQLCPVDAPVGDPAGSHQDAVVQLAAEVALFPHGAVVLPLGTAQLQPQPDPWGKVRGTNVPDGAHFIGAGQENLGAFVQLHGPLAGSCSAAAPAAPQHGALRSREKRKEQKTSCLWFLVIKHPGQICNSRKCMGGKNTPSHTSFLEKLGSISRY